MLRNTVPATSYVTMPSFLNEVLSLNAQEFMPWSLKRPESFILNEVLSLNAQEYLEAGGKA